MIPDPVLRAVALLKLARDRKGEPEGKVAHAALLRHLRRTGLTLDRVRAALGERSDVRARTPAGWATRVWHVELGVQIAATRGAVCTPYRDGRVIVRGPGASRTLSRIQEVREKIETVRPMAGTWAVTSFEVGGADTLLYAICPDADDVVLVAAVQMAYRRRRGKGPVGARSAIPGPVPGRASDAPPVPSAPPPSCACPGGPPPPPCAAPNFSLPEREDDGDEGVLPYRRIRETRAFADDFLHLHRAGRLPGNTQIRFHDVLARIPTDVTDPVDPIPPERRIGSR